MRVDPFTKEEFEPKRANQVYATRENQIKANNHRKKELAMSNASIIKPILNNLNILKALMGVEKSIEVTKDFLRGAGFNLQVFSSVGTVKENGESTKMSVIGEFAFNIVGQTVLIKRVW